MLIGIKSFISPLEDVILGEYHIKESSLHNPLPADNFRKYKKKHTPKNNVIL